MGGDDKDNSRQSYFCVDLSSIRPEPSSADKVARLGVIFDTVSIPAATVDDVDVALKDLTGVPSYDITERDGYPLRCQACGGEVVQGHMEGDNGSPFGLGRAACPACFIRFSAFRGEWSCWQLVPEDGEGRSCLKECNAVVKAPHYKCSAIHANVTRTINTTIKKRGRHGQATVDVYVKKAREGY